jgi:predicted lipoprotein with Yx(FWY)xxD motif
MKKMTSILVLAFMAVIMIGSFQTVSAAPFKVMYSGNEAYLADSNGMTLYIYLKDTEGKATCVGQCVQRWPVFYTERVMVPAGMDAKEFGVITHPSGQKQNTFRGWPLYYWVGDKVAGDTTGQGRSNVWYYVLSPMAN